MTIYRERSEEPREKQSCAAKPWKTGEARRKKRGGRVKLIYGFQRISDKWTGSLAIEGTECCDWKCNNAEEEALLQDRPGFENIKVRLEAGKARGVCV